VALCNQIEHSNAQATHNASHDDDDGVANALGRGRREENGCDRAMYWLDTGSLRSGNAA